MGIKISFTIFLSFLLLEGTFAVQYTVTNNAKNQPGGRRFDHEIGVNSTLEKMNSINQFIYKVFKQNSEAQRKNVSDVNVYISQFSGFPAYSCKNNINISARALAKMAPGCAWIGFTSILAHEMTHIFQWTGQGTAPKGLLDGIADYVMINYVYLENYTKPGTGARWDEGYGVTARFLEYCDSLKEGFIADLNKIMRYEYSDRFFQILLGKPVDELWKEYKAKYRNIPSTNADISQDAKY